MFGGDVASDASAGKALGKPHQIKQNDTFDIVGKWNVTMVKDFMNFFFFFFFNEDLESDAYV